MPEQHPSVRNASVRKLLLQLGAGLVAGGQPIYEVEEELRRVAWSLGFEHAQCSCTPTSVMVSLSPGEAASMLQVRSPLSLEQSTVVNEIRRGLMSHRLGVAQALAELADVTKRRPRWGDRGVAAGNMCVAAGICLIMQPAWQNVLLAAGMGLIVTFLMRLSRTVSVVGTLLPIIASLSTALVALSAASLGLVDGPLRTLICSIAVLLPGATLATGMAELAAGMMISGSSRVIYGVTQLLLFTLGLVGATLLLRLPMSALDNTRVAVGSPFFAPVALLLITSGIILMESLPLRLAPWVFGLLTATFLAQAGGQAWLGQPAVGAFIGATVASFGAAALEATQEKLPRLVVFLPSFWLLVPGTLGLIGVTELGTHRGLASVEALLAVVVQVLSISLGLLVGSALARPIHAAARRYRRRRAAASPELAEPIGPDDAEHPSAPPMPRPGVDVANETPLSP